MADDPAAASADPELIKSLTAYVKKSCPGVVGGDAKTLETALASKEAEESLRIFANDSQISCLIVQRKLKRKLAPGEDPLLVTDNEYYVFELQMKPLEDSNGGAAMAYLKIAAPLDSTTPLHSQLHVVQIDEKNPFAAILAYVRHCFLPFTRSLMATALENDKTNESDLGSIRGVNTKLGELEVELLRSQEQVEIPHIILDVYKPVDDYVKGGKSGELADASDPNFLNEVQKRLNEWKKQILAVTRLNRDVDSGTTMHEINFWMSMEKAIQHIYSQRESEGVEFTFQLLKDNKRFLATTGFMPDVGLSDDKEKDNVYKFSALLRDFPIKPLISAADVNAIMAALETIFNHLKQIRRIEYPLERAIQLVHAISRDMVTTLTSVLNARRPMALNFEEFDRMTQQSEDLFNMWNSQWEVFSDELRDLQKQRPDENTIKLPLPFEQVQALRTRLADVRKLRKEHEELRSVVSTTLTTDPMVQNNALKAIQEAYQHLRDVDVLGVSQDQADAFDSAVKSYKAKIDRVECDLEDRIREMLTAAKDDANEMFRVCAKFNALFVRPRIQSAIREYQEQLTATVKKDIEGLQEKFKSTYSRSQDCAVSSVRDLHPVSGSILWGRQIERQLDTYMSRIEDVLGKQWVHHTEGRTLSRECEQFRQRLQPDKIFQQWLSDNKEIAQSFAVEGRIFKVEINGSAPRSAACRR
jgi:dynein heavy chain 1